jgi:hypothetical protein
MNKMKLNINEKIIKRLIIEHIGKEPSENFETAKGSLPRALYRAHGKAFAEGKKNPRQRKTLGKM